MNRTRQRSTLLIAAFGVALAGFSGIGAVSAPDAMPVTTEAELGRLLFWDPILSGERDVSCATCHHPDFAYADGRALSLGPRAIGIGPDRSDTSGGDIPVVKRNFQSILNVAFNGLDRRGGRGRGGNFAPLPSTVSAVNQERAPMFWDHRVRSLEEQALAPIAAREEMRGDAYPEDEAIDRVLERLREIPEYVALFRHVYGQESSIDADQLGGAIAAFERTLVAGNSPFDRFLAGDAGALTPQQLRGRDAFVRADCTQCHRGPMLSNFDLHAEGVREHPLLAEPDAGDGRFRFRTPTLRNVALTAPYMHNGMLATLDDVLAFYDRGRSENENVANGGGGRGRRGNNAPDGALATLDRDFRGVRDMSTQEQRDIVAFLHALTDEVFDRTIPARVPSGLTPGGAIGQQTLGRVD